MSQAEQARRFAAALLGNHGELLSGLQITLSTLPGPSTRWLPAQPDAVADSILAASRTTGTIGVYTGVGLTRGRRAINPATGEHYKRLAVPDVDGLAWLWIDIDLAGEAHGDRMPLCPDEAAALSIIADTGLPPTIIVRTGHGVQAYWRLATPLIFGWRDGEIDDDGAPIIDPQRVTADRGEAYRLVKDWVKTLQIRGKRLGGWHVDPTSDMARMLRAPGSVNYKLSGDARRVEIVECDPARVYDLDQITASLAPEELLAAHRYSTADGGTALKGVDLVALWNEVSALPEHTPELVRLAMQAEGEWGGTQLTELWTGAADERYGNDDSTVDIALAKCLFDYDFTAADCAQAIMGRRLKIGRKPEKANPTPGDPRNRGEYYLGITVGKALASHRERAEQARQHSERVARAERDREAAMRSVSGAELEPGPAESGVLTMERDGSDSPGDAPEPEQAQTSPLPPLRAAPEPITNDAREVYADAPREPRQGLDDPTPAGPSTDEQRRTDELTAMLGLPEGITVWAVGIRHLADHDQIRVWFYRGEGAEVHGGDWPVGSLGRTRWLSKAKWRTSSPRAETSIQEMLLEELHIVCKPAADWKSEGRKILFALARNMPQGTPADVAQRAIRELLGRTPGTSVFAACRDSGDPWVTETEVWVRCAALRDEVRKSGMGLGGPDLLDVLADLGCCIANELTSPDGVTDPCQWVKLPETLPDTNAEFWATVRRRARDNDDDILSARRELRRVGGEK